MNCSWACRSAGRSSPLQGEGPGFESQQVHYKCTRQVTLPGKDEVADDQVSCNEIVYMHAYIRRSLDKVRWTLVNMPSGEWLGSSADEGRAKLR